MARTRPASGRSAAGFGIHSLRTRLIAVWGLSLLACFAVGVLLAQLSRQSAQAQVGRAEAVVARACDLIADRWRFYASGWSGPEPAKLDARLRADLNGLVGVALARLDGIEGGVWQSDSGPLAYAFPTYEGTGPKTDLPAAERARIEAVNQQAARDEQPVSRSFAGGSQTLLLHACPLPGPINGLTAWTMTRTHPVQGLGPLRLGLGVLFVLMGALALLLGRTLLVWGRHIRGIRGGLAAAGRDGIPALQRTGEHELDEIVDALNDAGRRVAEARREADDATARAARDQRLAGLGRVAAGIAHEIRNPIAAARLQGENALAGDDMRRRAAIADMLDQLGRLDRLVTELLAMTQRVTPRPQTVNLHDLLTERAATVRDAAAAKRVDIGVCADGDATLDPAVVSRILDNLLTNAVRHAPAGGTVRLLAERADGKDVTITVADSGAGVAPELAKTLFEPFVTGRPDGTGLGLAIARELAEAHGGRLELRMTQGEAGGAVFALVLPQTTSGTSTPCPPS